MRKDSVTLEWDAPADDGGARLTGYVIEKRDTRKSRWTYVHKVGEGHLAFYYVHKVGEGYLTFYYNAVHDHVLCYMQYYILSHIMAVWPTVSE